jgi:hypothetical protein
VKTTSLSARLPPQAVAVSRLDFGLSIIRGFLWRDRITVSGILLHYFSFKARTLMNRQSKQTDRAENYKGLGGLQYESMWNRLTGINAAGPSDRKASTVAINKPKPISTACRQAHDDHTKNILYLRFLMSGILLLAAALCSTLSYFLLRGGETKLFQTQYDSIATSALNSVVSNFGRMNIGLQAMASTYSANFPDAQTWPYVAWPGFRRTAEKLGTISTIDNISFSPLVRPANRTQYEEYMAAYYANDTTILPPNYIVDGLTAGMVWTLDEQLIPVHDTTGCTPFSHQCLMLPSSQYTYSETIGPSYLGFNLHSYAKITGVFDASMKCAAENNASYAANFCGGVSTFVELPFATFLDPNPDVLDIQAQSSR